MAAKSPTIKGAGGKFGGCALKAVVLITGGLLQVLESGLRVERSTLTMQQKSAAGILGHPGGRRPKRKEAVSRRRDSMGDKRQKIQLRLALRAGSSSRSMNRRAQWHDRRTSA
jgi:hypothetical protein